MQAFVTDSLNKLLAFLDFHFTATTTNSVATDKLRSFMPLRAALAKSGPLYFPSEKSFL